MIAAGRSCGLPVIVRVAHFDPGQINRLLEAGAAGIQLPQVQTREQVAAFRAACKYPPEGSRSVSLAQPAAGYGSEPLTEYLASQQSRSAAGGPNGNARTGKAFDHACWTDLMWHSSARLISPWIWAFPASSKIREFSSAFVKLKQAAATANVHLGIYADSPARAAQAAAAGYRMIALSSDLGALAAATKSWIKTTAGTFPREHRAKHDRLIR